MADDLAERGFAAGAVHGDLGQGAREQALRAFRNGKVDVLVATDVAARGIDVEGVTHVINYQCPEDEKTYLHRIGRTGRAGATGIAITFVDWDDIPRWTLINKALGLDFDEPAETYSTSDAPLQPTSTSREGTKGRAAQAPAHPRGPRRRGGRGPRRDRQGAGAPRPRPRSVAIGLASVGRSGGSRGDRVPAAPTAGASSSCRRRDAARPARTRPPASAPAPVGGAPVAASANGSPNGSRSVHLDPATGL